MINLEEHKETQVLLKETLQSQQVLIATAEGIPLLVVKVK